MINTINIDSIQTESDVEQKVVMPLLTLPKPQGFEFQTFNIKTKPDIRRFEIGKGNKERKLYYPDYIIIISGLPMLIVEAKAPNETLDDGYREARLYATELNATYPTDINPASKIICTNGKELIAGSWDSDTPKFYLKSSQLNSVDILFAQLVEYIDIKTLSKEASNILKEFTKRPFSKPVKLLGGSTIRNEEIGYNSFGATLSLDCRHIFNPTSKEERAYIVKHAYVPSKRRERYAQPIDKIIRAAAPPSESNARLVENTEEPKEIYDTLRMKKNLEQQVLLLIGGVGTGKSTFIDYIRNVQLPQDLLDTTVWVHINMNNAPISQNHVYDWLCEELIKELKTLYPDIDFDTLEEIQKLYGPELNKLKKYLTLLDQNSEAYKTRIVDEITKLTRENLTTAIAFSRYLCNERGKLLVVVLDNCDKRMRDEQLLMFQAAQWFQRQFRCLVILPLRDETYDNHRNEPPLDTALKDLVFRIEPPLFSHVLNKRLMLALKEMKDKSLHYYLPNSMRVEYPASEQGYYLLTILKSVFEYDTFVSKLILGLAGRDLRKAMEIFLEFCTSGHIGEDQIFKIKQSQGKYILPYNVVARVILRGNRRFYDSEQSYVKNLLCCNPDDPKPNYFIRIAILRWLKNYYRTKGPINVPGYHPVRKLKLDLVPIGFSNEMLQRELLILLKSRCIVAEHFKLEDLNDDDLIRLAPAGFKHLEMVENTEYLAAIAEDTWFDEEALASQIASRISHKAHYSIESTIAISEIFTSYLNQKAKEPFFTPDKYLSSQEYQYLINIENAYNVVKAAKKDSINSDPFFDIENRFQEGQEVKGTVKKHTSHGVSVHLGDRLFGLIKYKLLNAEEISRLQKKINCSIYVRIEKIRKNHKQIDLSLSKIEI